MLRTHPERLALGVGVVAWGLMLIDAVKAQRPSCCRPDAGPVEAFATWMLMILAMMLPTTMGSLRDVARRSYRTRRVRGIVGYLVGYLLAWTTLGVIVVVLQRLLPIHDVRIATASCVAAAAWALLPAHQRWFGLRHRRIALCPLGWRADRDAFRQGAVQGVPCVLTCWPLMVACAATGHHVVMMVAGSALVAFEKRMFRLEPEPLAAGALALAAWTLTL